jgi:hypothetical protein
MKKFEYRSPRFAVDLPVQFGVDQATLSGRCRNISRDGMKLDLHQPLPADAHGTVFVSHQNQLLELSVRVTHTGGVHGGLEFLYKSDRERDAVARLVASVTACEPRRLVLVN